MLRYKARITAFRSKTKLSERHSDKLPPLYIFPSQLQLISHTNSKNVKYVFFLNILYVNIDRIYVVCRFMFTPALVLIGSDSTLNSLPPLLYHLRTCLRGKSKLRTAANNAVQRLSMPVECAHFPRFLLTIDGCRTASVVPSVRPTI